MEKLLTINFTLDIIVLFFNPNYMNKHISALLTLSAVLPISVLLYEEKLNITPRLENGSIVQDVQRVQGKAKLDPSHPQYETLRAAYERRVEANMTSLRGHVKQVRCANGDENSCPKRSEW